MSPSNTDTLVFLCERIFVVGKQFKLYLNWSFPTWESMGKQIGVVRIVLHDIGRIYTNITKHYLDLIFGKFLPLSGILKS